MLNALKESYKNITKINAVIIVLKRNGQYNCSQLSEHL